MTRIQWFQVWCGAASATVGVLLMALSVVLFYASAGEPVSLTGMLVVMVGLLGAGALVSAGFRVGILIGVATGLTLSSIFPSVINTVIFAHPLTMASVLLVAVVPGMLWGNEVMKKISEYDAGVFLLIWVGSLGIGLLAWAADAALWLPIGAPIIGLLLMLAWVLAQNPQSEKKVAKRSGGGIAPI